MKTTQEKRQHMIDCVSRMTKAQDPKNEARYLTILRNANTAYIEEQWARFWNKHGRMDHA